MIGIVYIKCRSFNYVYFILFYYLYMYMYLYSWKGRMSKFSKYILKKKMVGLGMKFRSLVVLVKCFFI